MQFLRIFFFSLVLSPVVLSAQYSVSGWVMDSSNQALPSATIMLLRAEDSVLSSFGLSDRQGVFKLKGIASGNYFLQCTYIGFEDYTQAISVEDADLESQLIKMRTANEMLDAVQIEGIAPAFKIDGDTLEYNADRFETLPNASVEDLLKQLPGVEVDEDGTVRAQGEEVDRVLVDGKEFFGNDPRMATQNLPSDAVDQVQVYDRLSDLSRYTGIDDGTRDKTMNLVLKEDKKQGIFGKLEGAYGTENTYRGKFNLHRFDKRQQLSLIGNANNIYEQAFSLQDYVQFMGGIRALMQSGGRIELDGTGASSAFMPSNQAGDVDAAAGGFNLNQQFGSKKQKNDFNLNYLLNRRQQEISTARSELQLNSEADFESQADQYSLEENWAHNLNSMLEWNADSSNRLMLRVAGSYSWGDSRDSLLEFNQQDAIRINQNNQLWNGSGIQWNTSASALYNHRFKKAGRNLSLQLQAQYDNSDNDLAQIGNSSFFDPDGAVLFTDSSRQFIEEQSTPFQWSPSLTYSEPLGKNYYLGLSSSYSSSEEQYKRLVFPSDLELDSPVDSLSAQYNKNWSYSRAGISIRKAKKKFNLQLRLDAQRSWLKADFSDFSINEDSSFQSTRLDFLPSARMRLELGRGKNLEIEYNSMVQEPQAYQLNPVADISNPLNIQVGNPLLAPQLNHNISFNYFLFDAFSFTSLFVNASAGYTDNNIVWSRAVSENLIQSSQPINYKYGINARVSSRFSTPIRPIKSKISLGVSGDLNRDFELINDIENQIYNWAGNADLRIENRKKDIIDINAGIELRPQWAFYSISDELDRNTLDWTSYANFRARVKSKWILRTGLDFLTFGGSAFETQDQIFLWEASISRYLFKANRGEISLIAKDLLNQNNSIRRSLESASIVEERSNALGRYIMLQFSWSPSLFGNRQGGLF